MSTSERNTPALGWVLRVAWICLPLALGPPLTDAIGQWAGGPRTAAEALAWAGWGAGLLSVLAPRPLGLTVFRIAAAGGVGTAVAVAVASNGPAIDVVGGLISATLAGALVTSTCVTEWAANAAAYGNERRLALRTPVILGWVIAPCASLLILACATTGPLLLADGRWLVGLPALIVGGALAARLGRSLHALSQRWIICVPGGLVIHDPLALLEPVLVPWASIRAIAPLGTHPPEALDLRLGARSGIHITADPPIRLPVRHGFGNADVVPVTDLVVSPSRLGAALRLVAP